jgi:hypothetical protein
MFIVTDTVRFDLLSHIQEGAVDVKKPPVRWL